MTSFVDVVMKVLVLLFSFFLATPISYVNYRSFGGSQYVEISGCSINKNLLQQLAFLKRTIHSGVDEEMQQSYPEGAAFMLSLYGLSWCAVAEALPYSSKTGQEAISEATFALGRMHQFIDDKVVDHALPLAHGAFYTSWPLYLQAHLLKATPAEYRNPIDLRNFEETCDQIIEELNTSKSPFLESYPGAAWPADQCPAIAALAIHDRILPAKYQYNIEQWLLRTKELLDPRGLIPHSVNPKTGTPLQKSLGSSQSLILSFMHEIDSATGAEMFVTYKDSFLTKRFGLPGVREYPKGEKGAGHIDAGPIVWGIGGAASIVGVRPFYLYGELGTARAIRNSINAFAFVREKKQERFYLFGKWPMADAFMAWSNSLEVTIDKKMKPTKPWKSSFNMGSILILLALGYWNKRFWTIKA